MKRMIHFGAGNIGRGLIAPIMQASDYQMTFVDINREIINKLSENKEYTITYWDGSHSTRIHGYNAVYDTSDEEFIDLFKEVHLVTTAVTPNGLDGTAKTLARLLEERKSENKYLVIMACENMEHATSYLKTQILNIVSAEVADYINEWVYFPNTAIDRNIPNQDSEDGLSLHVEKYHELVIEDVAGKVPGFKGADFVDDLAPFIERKLFMVNNAHASTGYYASLKGYQDMKPAFQDVVIREFLDGLLKETEKLLIHKYPALKEDIEKYYQQTYHRFTEEFQNDSIGRVCRNPKRKLSYNERILSPTRQYIYSFLEIPHYLLISITSGLHYNNPEDSEACEIQEMIEKNGIEQTIKDVTGIEEYTELYKSILYHYNNIEV